MLLEGFASDLAFHLGDDAIGLGLCRAAAAIGCGAYRGGLENVISRDQKKPTVAKVGSRKERLRRGDIAWARERGLRKRNDRSCHELSPYFSDPVRLVKDIRAVTANRLRMVAFEGKNITRG